MPGSVFLDFVGFTLSGFWRTGAYFLIFHLLHSLGLDAGEWISCFFGFCTPWILVTGSVFLDFVGFTLSGFGGRERIS